MIEKNGNTYDNHRGYATISVHLVCGLLLGVIACIDLVTPLGIAIGALYVIAVLLSFWSPTTKSTYWIALTSSTLIVAVFFYKPPVAEMWKVILNRFLSLFVIWVTTFLGVRIKKAEERLVEMASHDFLTGLLNRREMLARLSVEHSRVNRMDETLSIIMMDIDHFKSINDVHGHIAGDMVLKEIARRLRDGVREYDLICRFGGEEFLIMAPETAATRAAELAERLRVMVSDIPFYMETIPPVGITISAGVTQLVEGESIEEMLSRADSALYRAKAQGRNRIAVL